MNKGVAPPSDYPESSWRVFGVNTKSEIELQRWHDFQTQLDELYLPIGVPGLGIETKGSKFRKNSFLFFVLLGGRIVARRSNPLIL